MTAAPGFVSRAAAVAPVGDGLPAGAVAAGTIPVVMVAVSPAHPSTVVEVQRDDGRGPVVVERASRTGWSPDTGSVHTGYLPALAPGSSLRYRVVARRAGQEVGAVPPDGSWIKVEGDVPSAVPESVAGSAPGGTARSTPRWTYDLTFFAALTVDLRAEVLGPTPEGYRINFFVKDGWVRGPGIDARVLPEGGDWMCIRPDGIGQVDITITYQTNDGALVMERSGGVFDLGPDGYDKVVRGDFKGAPPFYATPSWSTSHPAWTWLNRRQGFGIGRVVLDQLQVRCDIYLPEVGGPLAGGGGPGA